MTEGKNWAKKKVTWGMLEILHMTILCRLILGSLGPFFFCEFRSLQLFYFNILTSALMSNHIHFKSPSQMTSPLASNCKCKCRMTSSLATLFPQLHIEEIWVQTSNLYVQPFSFPFYFWSSLFTTNLCETKAFLKDWTVGSRNHQLGHLCWGWQCTHK